MAEVRIRRVPDRIWQRIRLEGVTGGKHANDIAVQALVEYVERLEAAERRAEAKAPPA